MLKDFFVNVGNRAFRKFDEKTRTEDYDGTHINVATIEDADIIVSRTVEGDEQWNGYNVDTEKIIHYPVLDLDIPHRYFASTTDGHGHLYLDVPITWKQYRNLLAMLADIGILEDGYVNASLNRQYTSVRLPWVKKEVNPDAQESESPF